MIRVGFLALAAMLLIPLPCPAAQHLPPSATDSVRTLREARREQSRFEFIRRHHLPWTWSRGGIRCDERIGRFCLQHDDNPTPWEPKPEHAKVQDARVRLNAHLAKAAAHLPGDRWITGQQIRYLVESGQTERAYAAARACRAEHAWCLALQGYALHAGEDWFAADSVFAGALQAMPEEQRRAWTDLSELLPPGDAGRYRRLTDSARVEFEGRFWWLADPLWSVPGNERRTEHFARLVVAELQDRSGSAEGIPWGDDLRELLLRYGWPAGWERQRTAIHHTGPPPIVTHYEDRSWSFLPTAEMMQDPLHIRDEDWALDAPKARSNYAPGYARSWDRLDHQAARFRRGDTAVVVAAYEVRSDSILPDAELETTLVLATGPAVPPVITREIQHGRVGRIVARTTAAPQLASLESRSTARKQVARARFALAPSAGKLGGIAVSDLLLVDPGESLPDELSDAVQRALPGARFRADGRIGIYWEMYAADPAERDVRYELALLPEAEGWLGRAGARLGVRRGPDQVRIGWAGRLPADEVVPRSLAVNVSNLRPGRYTLRLSVMADGEHATTTERAVEIER